jgi:hypothetical protein
MSLKKEERKTESNNGAQKKAPGCSKAPGKGPKMDPRKLGKETKKGAQGGLGKSPKGSQGAGKEK